MIKDVITIIYLYGLLPLLVGLSVVIWTGRSLRFSSIFAQGYVLYLAVFQLMISWAAHQQMAFSQFSKIWGVVVYLLSASTIVSVVFALFYNRKKQNISVAKRLKNSRIIHNRERWITVILSLILIALSILFLVPHALDETPELARLTIMNDSFFSLNPSTATPYPDSSSCPGFIHVFYAFGAIKTGIDVTTLIHLIIPVFMIPLFVSIYFVIADLILPDAHNKKHRYHFVWLITLFYLLMLPLEAHLALSPLRNIWNGMTLAASCMIPLLFSVCLHTLRYSANNLANDTLFCPRSIPKLISLIILSLSIQLCVRFGLVISGLVIVSSLFILLFRQIWHHFCRPNDVTNTVGGDQL